MICYLQPSKKSQNGALKKNLWLDCILSRESMTDQSENLTFFGCLVCTLRKKVFL
jgi:hypothetical protein